MTKKMCTQILLIFFGVIVQVCNVLGRSGYYEYYYSRYHKGHLTTTESILPSASSDNSSLQNHMYEPTGYTIDENYNTGYSKLIVGQLAGAVIFLCVVSCCLFCCIRHFCCTRKERRGFITAYQPGSAPVVVSQQTTRIHQPPEFQQPHTTQCYGERGQFFPPPPQYQPQPMQQFPPMQPQYSPTPQMQSHNPPEAPPPYEFPEKF